MTSQSPRIYLYKITFEEVPYYYYGIKREKYYNQPYMGSPVTHKWVWKFYTPKKQILEVFPYTDEGWLEANEVERRVILSFYNTDKWCLNENCAGAVSIDVCRRVGKINGKKLKESCMGIFAIPEKEYLENCTRGGKTAGNITYELKIGVHGRTKEQMIEDGRKGGFVGGEKGGNKCKEFNLGVCGLSKEELSNAGKIGGKKAKEFKLGIHGRTKEQMIEDGKRGGKISGNQKWMCTETGFVTNSGNLTKYQKKKGIDTSKRIRIE